jgi:hypothetical protein
MYNLETGAVEFMADPTLARRADTASAGTPRRIRFPGAPFLSEDPTMNAYKHSPFFSRALAASV